MAANRTNKRRIVRKRQQAHQKHDGRCAYCGEHLEAADLAYVDWHLDHLIPLAKGGGDVPENIVAACPACNLAKGNYTPEEFRRSLAAGLRTATERLEAQVMKLRPFVTEERWQALSAAIATATTACADLAADDLAFYMDASVPED